MKAKKLDLRVSSWAYILKYPRIKNNKFTCSFYRFDEKYGKVSVYLDDLIVWKKDAINIQMKFPKGIKWSDFLTYLEKIFL